MTVRIVKRRKYVIETNGLRAILTAMDRRDDALCLKVLVIWATQC